jgi:hypothetical protein
LTSAFDVAICGEIKFLAQVKTSLGTTTTVGSADTPVGFDSTSKAKPYWIIAMDSETQKE